MVKPNFIPRNLRGVGGIRLFDLPGVFYPREVLVTKAGLDHKSGLPYKEPPIHWGITTGQAADILGLSASATRSLLHRRKVPFRIVCPKGRPLCFYWSKARVTSLAKQRHPIVSKDNPSLITAAEAGLILGIARSTLYRYEMSGRLRVTRLRRPTSKGPRTCCFYNRKEVQKLAKYLSVMREYQHTLLSFCRAHHPFLPQQSPPPPPSSASSCRTRLKKNSK